MKADPMTGIPERFLENALAGNARAVVGIMTDLLDSGTPPEQVIAALAQAQRLIGDRWQRNESSISEEHLVSGCMQRALDALSAGVDLPTPHGVVVVACAEGDWHSLAAQMFSELLRLRGFTVHFLGSSTPADDVADFLARRRVDVLAVSCCMPIFFAGVTRLVDAAHAKGIPVIAGGRALGDSPARALVLGADAWARDVTQAALILRGWADHPPGRRRPPVGLDESALRLDRDAAALAESGFERLASTSPLVADYDQGQSDHVKETLTHALRSVAAARLVHDPSVFVDFLSWQAEVLHSRNVRSDALQNGLDALAPGVAETDPAAAEILRSGSLQ